MQGLVIYMTLALERRDFRGPGQLRFRLQPKIHSQHLQRHFQLGRTATTVLVELPNYGSCVRSEKGQTTPVSSLGHALDRAQEGSPDGSHLQEQGAGGRSPPESARPLKSLLLSLQTALLPRAGKSRNGREAEISQLGTTPGIGERKIHPEHIQPWIRTLLAVPGRSRARNSCAVCAPCQPCPAHFRERPKSAASNNRDEAEGSCNHRLLCSAAKGALSLPSLSGCSLF